MNNFKKISAIKNTFFCAGPAPLLWKGLFFFIPVLTMILFVLAVHAIFHLYKNKKRGRVLMDKVIKKDAIWLLVIFLSLMTYGIVGLDFSFYLLEFFIITLLILGAFFWGEHCKLFKVNYWLWLIVTVLAATFAIFFAVCLISAIQEKAAFINGMQTRCIHRVIF